jgi:hypothetical protein
MRNEFLENKIGKRSIAPKKLDKFKICTPGKW